MPKQDTDRIIRENECKTLSGLSRTTRYMMERRGEFPARRNIGGRSVGWLLSDIQDWQRTRQQQTHSN
ncbi:DNA-binding protein [Salmonella enterica]|nr:DNA-binding protein [Salmonella enterica]